MKNKKVLDSKMLPAKLPIWSSVTCAVALDHWNAPEGPDSIKIWIWGALGLFFSIGWIAIIATKITEEKVNYSEEESPNKKERISFEERLKEKMNQ